MRSALIVLLGLAGCGLVSRDAHQENPVTIEVLFDDGTTAAWDRDMPTTWTVEGGTELAVRIPAEPQGGGPLRRALPELAFTVGPPYQPGSYPGVPVSFSTDGMVYDGTADVNIDAVRFTGDSAFPWAYEGRLTSGALAGPPPGVEELRATFELTGPRCVADERSTDCGAQWALDEDQVDLSLFGPYGDCPIGLVEAYVDDLQPQAPASLSQRHGLDLGGTVLDCVRTVRGQGDDADTWACGADLADQEAEGCTWASTARAVRLGAGGFVDVTIQAGALSCADEVEPAPICNLTMSYTVAVAAD